MNISEKLQKGQTIGIIGLSSSILDFKEIDQGVAYLEALGYKVCLAPNVKENDYYFPGSAEVRARELENFFVNPDIDVIMALRGGFGAIHILNLLDYQLIKENPKIFIGFSDLTVLLNTLYTCAHLITFQGPMLTSNFAKKDHSLITDHSLFSMISGESDLITDTFNVLVNNSSQQIVEGTLVGGNLISFNSLLGTVYEPDFTDKILFFEDIDEKTYAIDRALSQLLLTGKLNKVKAIIFGDFSDCERRNEWEQELYPLIKDRLQGLGIPVVSRVQSGHCSPMLTIPIGAEVKLDLDKKQLTIAKKILE